jgi:hypothetical protein
LEKKPMAGVQETKLQKETRSRPCFVGEINVSKASIENAPKTKVHKEAWSRLR